MRALGPRGWWLLLVAVVGVWLMNTTPRVVPRVVVSDAAADPSQQTAPVRLDPPASRLLD